jgi:hypothetical protein
MPTMSCFCPLRGLAIALSFYMSPVCLLCLTVFEEEQKIGVDGQFGGQSSCTGTALWIWVTGLLKVLAQNEEKAGATLWHGWFFPDRRHSEASIRACPTTRQTDFFVLH